MQPWSFAAVAFLLAAGAAFLVGDLALAEAHDLLALYWLSAGAVTLKAAFTLAARRRS